MRPPSALNSTRLTGVRPRPRAALDQRAPGAHVPSAREELRHPGRRHQRARPLARDRRSRVLRGAAVAVQQRLLNALEGLGDRGDRPQPLDRGHAVPLGDDEPQREAVRRRQRVAVHGVGQQDVAGHRVLDRQAALVVLLDALIEPAVLAGEQELDGVVEQPGLLEHAAQGRPGPLGAADRLVVPRRRDRARREVGAARAGALHHHRHRDRRPGAQRLEGQRRGRRTRPSTTSSNVAGSTSGTSKWTST